jgi:toxin ParE1/3/4
VNYRLEISAPAHNDLVDIRAWIAADAGVQVAERYIDRVTARFERLTFFPSRGTPQPDAGVGIRSSPFERRRVIFYRVDADTVTILRVLDGARDLGRVLG